jgi:hypothetical protein
VACCNNQSANVFFSLLHTKLFALKHKDKYGEYSLDHTSYYIGSTTIINVLKSVMEMSEYELENHLNMPMVVIVNGLENR